MLYLHDVWVNWFEGAENSYNVCYFHEWRKTDQIELLDQVPLLYITDELYEYIENDLQDLPSLLLKKIHDCAYIRKGQKRMPLEYASVVTNGKEIVAFDTVGYEIPIRKSRLIPRQEQIVYDMIKHEKQLDFKIPLENYRKTYHLLSIAPDQMFGLTRRERQLKQVLMMALDQLRMTKHIEELRYWLTEWQPKKYPLIRYMNETEVWEALYQGLKNGWSKKHEEFGSKLIKGHPVLEKMWSLEQEHAESASQ